MKLYTFILLLTIFFSNSLFAQSDIKKDKWHWNNNTKQDTVIGYAQVVRVDNVLYISGAVTSELTPKGIDQVYKVLESSLKSFGATFQNVVKENLYTTDMETMKKLNQVRIKYYKNDFPAATWVQVNRLYMESAKLEVELIAHLPKQ